MIPETTPAYEPVAEAPAPTSVPAPAAARAPETPELTFDSLFAVEPEAPATEQYQQPEQLQQPAQYQQPQAPEQPPQPGAESPPGDPLNFDDLLAGAGDPADPVFLEPRPFVDSADSDQAEPVVTTTTHTDTELDTLFAPPVSAAAPAVPAIDEVEVIEDAIVIDDPNPPVETEVPVAVAVSAPLVETASLEPTPLDRRVGRAARLFWLWFAANSSIVSVAFGAVIFGLGMSLRQAIIGTLFGIVLSFLPLGLGTLAGKRSGQPTMVVSRAAFGVRGNVVPAAVALITRIFWGAALLWILGASVAAILVSSELDGGIGASLITLITVGVGALIAIAFAVFGYSFIAKLQLVITIVSAVLIAGLIAITWRYVDFGTAINVRDGSWTLVLTATVLVFSFVGLVWVNSSSDLARYQGPTTSGAGSMLAGSFGSTLPTFILIAYGALLAASNPRIAQGLTTEPLETIGLMLPTWYPVPLIAATALGLLSGVVVTIYSGGFALQSVGARMPRLTSAVVIGVLVTGGAVTLALLSTDFTELFRDVATTIAVPVAAWAGIFVADTIVRSRPYDTRSLLAPGGIYPTVNWVNLSAFIVITVLGLGLTSATLAGLDWQGYLIPLLGISATDPLATSDLGVVVALLLGLLVPLAAGIPSIRKQESVAAAPN